MMIVLSVLLIIAIALWYIESRIFLVLFHRLIFLFRNNPPVLEEKEYFSEAELLESHWETIRREVEEVLSQEMRIPRFHEVDPANQKISFSEGKAWQTLILKAFDEWFEANCILLPETTKLLRDCPTVSAVIISILEPGCHIPAHTGKFKGILRYHLGLMVPREGSCFMNLAGEKIHWKEGRSILFDDTFEHEVFNQSEEYRVVLFLNIKRKMNGLTSLINQFLLRMIRLSPVIKRGLVRGQII